MKESTILPQKCKIPQIFVPSQTEVYPRVGLCSLGWNFAPLGLYYSPRYARGSKVDPREQSPTLGSKVLPSGKLLPEMEKKSSGFFISEEGKVHFHLSYKSNIKSLKLRKKVSDLCSFTIIIISRSKEISLGMRIF